LKISELLEFVFVSDPDILLEIHRFLVLPHFLNSFMIYVCPSGLDSLSYVSLS